jgi:tripartite-type tricarboxylate transporter receptor subunit TctC
VKALESADVRAAMERLGLGQDPSNPEALRARIKKETAKWTALIKEVGIRVQ